MGELVKKKKVKSSPVSPGVVWGWSLSQDMVNTRRGQSRGAAKGACGLRAWSLPSPFSLPFSSSHFMSSEGLKQGGGGHHIPPE